MSSFDTYTSSMNVCTYNVGKNISDYYQLCCHNDPSLEITEQDSKEAAQRKEEAFIASHTQQYAVAQSTAARWISERASVIFLQEVSSEQRDFIQILKERDFEIIHFNQEDDPLKCGTAVAISKKRFKDIKNHSVDAAINGGRKQGGFNRDIAIATVIDRNTGLPMTLSSGHVPGFDLRCKELCKIVTQDGDNYCEALASQLSGPIQIVGADMNCKPEQSRDRFDAFTKKGFLMQRTNSPTNVNPDQKSDKPIDRELDFTFTKSEAPIISRWTKIKSIFVSTFNSMTATNLNSMKVGNVQNELFNLKFKPWNNPSDHIPVFTQITITMNRSKISQLCYRIWDVTSSLFTRKILAKA